MDPTIMASFSPPEGMAFSFHAVDAVGLVHALLLRVQAVVLPIKVLVFGGH